MNELERIRQNKINSMLNSNKDQQEETQRIQEQFSQIESMIKQRFTKEALERYGNIKTADPKKAVQVMGLLGQMLEKGSVNTIKDSQLKEMLRSLSAKREITIKRK
jgi:DNA-binding TFAR19-related protein (PDSD5 family)